jgi:Tfp pilus assembly protein PilF
MTYHRLSVMVFLLLFPVACSLPGPPGGEQIPNLTSPDGMSNRDAAAKNNEGVDHLVQGHWSIAEGFLREAIEKKNNFAEAHFNLGVALDGMDKHPEATEEFRKALEFGKDNPKIADAEILKKHLGM